jgi:hypothetical protein
MSPFPKEPKKIKERIFRYERELQKEYEKFRFISDGSGKRYLLGPLYMLLGDIGGALRSFEWFESTFPDDEGEPFQYLCWSSSAGEKFRQTILSNLYLIPSLLGFKQEKLDIWHSSNVEEPEYVQYGPPELLALWDEPALQWAKKTYESQEFHQIRLRYIEIYHHLLNEHPGPKRSQLVDAAFKLRTLSL